MISFFFFFVFVTTCSAGPVVTSIFPDGRIFGGEDAVIETYPYQISLQKRSSHVCGGAIISEYYVLTAGHCVNYSVNEMTVRAGATFHNKEGSVHQVVKVIRHEKYTVNSFGIPSNDIALVHVKQPFKFDDTRQSISLYNFKEESLPGTNSVITGWGTSDKGNLFQLQTVIIPIITKDLCDKAYVHMGGLPEGQICAAFYGTGGKDACQGDSGGPLTIDGRLAGIVSWGNGCAEAYYPGAYTEVAYYRDWINEHIKI